MSIGKLLAIKIKRCGFEMALGNRLGTTFGRIPIYENGVRGEGEKEKLFCV